MFDWRLDSIGRRGIDRASGRAPLMLALSTGERARRGRWLWALSLCEPRWCIARVPGLPFLPVSGGAWALAVAAAAQRGVTVSTASSGRCVGMHLAPGPAIQNPRIWRPRLAAWIHGSHRALALGLRVEAELVGCSNRERYDWKNVRA